LSPLPCTCYPHATRMRTTCVLPAYRLTPQEYEGSLTGPFESPSDNDLVHTVRDLDVMLVG
jgi:hypothetical protein